VRHFLEIAQARFAKSLLSREETDKVALDAAMPKPGARMRRFNSISPKPTSNLYWGMRGSVAMALENSLSIDQMKSFLSPQAKERVLEQRPDYRAARPALKRKIHAAALIFAPCCQRST